MKIGEAYIKSPERRALDLLVASSLLGLLAVPGVFIAGVASTDTKTFNPIFRQERVGKDHKPFDAFKFRTLRPGLTEGPLEIHGTFDERATAIGQALRTSGADELPQLLNIIAGDMSVVGIRPVLPETLERYSEIVDPGLFNDWMYAYGLRSGVIEESSYLMHQQHEITPAVLVESMKLGIIGTENASLKNDLKLIGRSPIRILSMMDA